MRYFHLDHCGEQTVWHQILKAINPKTTHENGDLEFLTKKSRLQKSNFHIENNDFYRRELLALAANQQYRCPPSDCSPVLPSTSAVLSPPSVCLSIGLTNPLCLGEIHMSCLTAHCYVCPGRSVLCNLKLVLNAQACLYVERRLQREAETYREINTARKRQLEIG